VSPADGSAVAVQLVRPSWAEVWVDGVAGCTLRWGGTSPPPFDSLNMGGRSGDEPFRVEANRRRLAEAVGFDPGRLVVPRQVHGAEVRTVTEAVAPGECDGLVTVRPGLLLGVVVADCAPVILVDPDARVVAVCHAGWRGLVAGVVEATLSRAVGLGAEPDRVRAWTGPCIGPESFEVGEDVAAQLDPGSVRRPRDRERPLFDLPGAVAARLVRLGVRSERVEGSGVSTTGDRRAFSHRRDGPRTGRMLGFVGLYEER
jgi:hypothetical protein